jgi:hypothetical protein
MEVPPTQPGARETDNHRISGWPVIGMLFLFMLINFADRAVLDLAATPIMQELGLSHTQFGLRRCDRTIATSGEDWCVPEPQQR